MALIWTDKRQAMLRHVFNCIAWGKIVQRRESLSAEKRASNATVLSRLETSYANLKKHQQNALGPRGQTEPVIYGYTLPDNTEALDAPSK